MKHANYSDISISSSSAVSVPADLLKAKVKSKLTQKIIDLHKEEAEVLLQIIKVTVSSELYGGIFSTKVVASNKSSGGYCYKLKINNNLDPKKLISQIENRFLLANDNLVGVGSNSRSSSLIIRPEQLNKDRAALKSLVELKYKNDNQTLELSNEEKFGLIEGLLSEQSSGDIKSFVEVISKTQFNRTQFNIELDGKVIETNFSEYWESPAAVILQKAISAGRVELVKVLLAGGVDPNLKIKDGEKTVAAVKSLCGKLLLQEIREDAVKIEELKQILFELIDYGASLKAIEKLKKNKEIAEAIQETSIRKLGESLTQVEAKMEKEYKTHNKNLEEIYENLHSIPDSKWEGWNKEKINEDVIGKLAKTRAAHDIEAKIASDTTLSPTIKQNELEQQYKDLYSSFCQFLQSQVRMTLLGIVNIRADNLALKPSQSSLGDIVGMIPYIGSIAKLGLGFLSSKQQLITLKERGAHITSNEQQDAVIKDYCIRVTEFCQIEILSKSGNNPSGKTELILDKVTKPFLKIREEPEIRQHWKKIAAQYTLKFAAYLRDNPVNYQNQESNELGSRIADEVIPNWFRIKPTIDTHQTSFSLDNASSFSQIASLIHHSKDTISLMIKEKWNYETLEIIEKSDFRTIIFGDQEKLVIAFSSTGGAGSWLSNLNLREAGLKVKAQEIKVHEGLLKVVNDHWSNRNNTKKGIDQIIKGYMETHPEAKIYITGHELGGAIAAITYLKLQEMEESYNSTYLTHTTTHTTQLMQPPAMAEDESKMQVYTYGQPKWCKDVSKEVAQKLLGNHYYRITNKDDVVTTIPRETFGYSHVGTEYDTHGQANPNDPTPIKNTLSKAASSLPRLLTISAGDWLSEVLSPSSQANNIEGYAKSLKLTQNTLKEMVVESTQTKEAQKPILMFDIKERIEEHKVKSIEERLTTKKITKPAKQKMLEQVMGKQEEEKQETTEPSANQTAIIIPQVVKELQKAISSGGIEKAKELVNNHKIDLHQIENDLYTVMFWVALNGLTEIAKVLIELGANIEIKNNNGNTPLSLAAYNGHIQATKILIELGANIEAKDNNGNTPLSVAAMNGKTKVVKTLIELGANIEAKSNLGNTPLSLAAMNGKTKVVKTLIELGANIEAKNNDGDTLLNLAAYNGHIQVIKILIELGANIEAKDNNKGYAHMIWATISGKPDVAKVLTKDGINFEVKNSLGNTPLSVAAMNGKTEVVKTLIELGANIEAKSNLGNTPLSLAAMNGKTEVVKTLIELGANIEVKNHGDNTPLSLAAYNGHPQATKILIELGANLEAKDINGNTPLKLATMSGHVEVVCKINFIKSLHCLKQNKVKEAASYLEECIKALPFDFRAVSAFVGLKLRADQSGAEQKRKFTQELALKIKKTPNDTSLLFQKTMVFYHEGSFDKALDITKDLLTNGGEVSIAFLYALSLIKLGKFSAAAEMCSKIDAHFQGKKVGVDHKDIQSYIKGLILLEIEQNLQAYKLLKEVADYDSSFIEAGLEVAKLKLSVGYFHEVMESCKALGKFEPLLPLHNHKTLSHLHDQAKVLGELEEHKARDLAKIEQYEKLERELKEALDVLKVKQGLTKEQSALHFNIMIAKTKIHELFAKESGGSDLANLKEELISGLDYGYKLLDADATIPAGNLEKTLGLRPSYRGISDLVISNYKELQPEHPLFNKINEIIVDTRAFRNLLKTKEQKSFEAKELKELLSGLEEYYISYIDAVCSKYGKEYRQEKFAYKNSNYIKFIAELAEKGKPLAGVDPHPKVSMGCSKVFVEGKESEYLAGFGSSEDSGNKEAEGLYMHLSTASRKGLDTYGKHVVISHKGVHYKQMPYAPGIEFTVNSLNKILLDTISLPTRLLKTQGISADNYGKVTLYQASTTIPGQNLHDVLADPKYLPLIDMESFSALLISSLLTGTGDAKPDNFMVRFETDELSGDISSIKLIGVDNDIAFCNGRLGFKRLDSGKAKLYSDLLNVLFFFPQMDEPLPVEIRKLLTATKSKPEEIVSEWLRELHNQNGRYDDLKNSGFTNSDLEKLKLPIKLPKGTAIAIYERLLTVYELLINNEGVTHNILLRAFYPGISQYYEMKRSMKNNNDNPVACIKELYIDASEDEQLKEMLASSDKVKSRGGWKSASSAKMLDHAKFKERFNDSIEDLAKDFLESVDFSRLEEQDNAVCSIIGENLNFLQEFRLRKINETQLKLMFERYLKKEPLDSVKITLVGLNKEEQSKMEGGYTKKILQKLNIEIKYDDAETELPEASPKSPTQLYSPNQNPQALSSSNTDIKVLKEQIHILLEGYDKGAKSHVAIVSDIRRVVNLIIGSSEKDLQLLNEYGAESRYSTTQKFIAMMQDYPSLAAIGIELAKKGLFNKIEAHPQELMKKLFYHLKVEKFLDMIEAMVQASPNILLLRDHEGKLPCDIVKSKSFLVNTKYQFKLLAIMINAGTKIETENKIFDSFEGEENLIIKAAARGLQATEKELKTRKYDFNKYNNQTRKDLLHQLLDQSKSITKGDIDLLKLALQILQQRLKKNEISQEEADKLVWGNEQRESLWNIAKKEKLGDILDKLFKEWQGSTKPYTGELYNDIGEHDFTTPSLPIRKVSQYYHLIGWEMTIKEAIEGGKNTNLLSDIINRTNSRGNSLLYEMVKVESSRYAEFKMNKDEAILDLIEFGADATMTRRNDDMTPLEFAEKSGQNDLKNKMLKIVKTRHQSQSPVLSQVKEQVQQEYEQGEGDSAEFVLDQEQGFNTSGFMQPFTAQLTGLDA